MGAEEKCVKYDLKISLPLYKILYALIFMVAIVIVRGVSSAGEIIVAIEPNIALLASVFMADNYYKEYTNGHIQVFYGYPLKKKCVAELKRFFINWLYLLILASMTYCGFVLIYRPINFSSTPYYLMIINTLIASGISMFFMGMLSFTITNHTQNIGIGIGSAVLIWGILNSTIATKLPLFLQLFLMGKKAELGFFSPYYISRVLYLILGIILMFSNIYSLHMQPKYKKREWRLNNGNKN